MKRKKFYLKAIWFLLWFILFMITKSYHFSIRTVIFLAIVFGGYLLIDSYFYRKDKTQKDNNKK
ncbi:hypothetical protein K2V61_10595 [Staphylococcus simulans]|uniref:hypothetical protein n=1 Tax=Staphylococcus simulans TaxID=1286 RepID=UPI001E62693E|nr:hypothetical protein [Staphylococcus simulans]MCD8915994.1 hypothetical protein [Staphylococcus simulans]